MIFGYNWSIDFEGGAFNFQNMRDLGFSLKNDLGTCCTNNSYCTHFGNCVHHFFRIKSSNFSMKPYVLDFIHI